jgi:hypothetical protein
MSKKVTYSICYCYWAAGVFLPPVFISGSKQYSVYSPFVHKPEGDYQHTGLMMIDRQAFEK